jgi:acetolactate synthase-1/2/3 large subunit
VDERAALPAALAQCLASEGPYFMDVRVRSQENCFPMIAAGRGHQEVMLGG